jgi:hypothetical protein
VETPYPIAKLVPANRLADRGEIYRAIGPAEQVSITRGLVVRALATGRAEVERIG